MKSFSERNPLALGAIGILLILVLVAAALGNQRLPFLNDNKSYTAYFADAGGLYEGAIVEVSGYPVGKVSDIALDKDMPCIAIQIRERSAVTRISQQIKIDQFADFPVGRLQGETDKIAADKSGAAGDEEVHKRSDVWRVTNLIDR